MRFFFFFYILLFLHYAVWASNVCVCVHVYVKPGYIISMLHFDFFVRFLLSALSLLSFLSTNFSQFGFFLHSFFVCVCVVQPLFVIPFVVYRCLLMCPIHIHTIFSFIEVSLEWIHLSFHSISLHLFIVFLYFLRFRTFPYYSFVIFFSFFLSLSHSFFHVIIRATIHCIAWKNPCRFQFNVKNKNTEKA